MENVFLTVLFFVGIVIATMQDLKRREVDNWLNLSLLLVSFSFVAFGAIINSSLEVIFHAGFLIIFMFVIHNAFYYARVFAGGDAKLLFAMSLFFMGGTFLDSLSNIGVFLLFLMVSGSFYGICYSGVLWWKNKRKVNEEMGKILGENRWLVLIFIFGALFMVFGKIYFWFFISGIFLIIYPLLYVFAKGLENVSMVREVSGRELREGDWLVKDVRVGKRLIRADWDGLSVEDIKLLKGKKKVLIKDGLPFVPAFLIAFLGYLFLRDWFFGLFLF